MTAVVFGVHHHPAEDGHLLPPSGCELRAEATMVGSVLKHIINSTRAGGVVLNYFAENARWEGELRAQFAEMCTKAAREGVAAETAADLLRKVDKWYKTDAVRYRRLKEPDGVTIACRHILSHIERSWWIESAPPILDCAATEAIQLRELPHRILASFREAGLTQEYSLVTKFLHFCFPVSIAIFDSRAANSIEACSRTGSITTSSIRYPSGYGGILDFYRDAWNLGSAEERSLLANAALGIQQLLRERAGQRSCRVTEVDLIDKFLWRANGDRVQLGLESVA